MTLICPKTRILIRRFHQRDDDDDQMNVYAQQQPVGATVVDEIRYTTILVLVHVLRAPLGSGSAAHKKLVFLLAASQRTSGGWPLVGWTDAARQKRAWPFLLWLPR